MEHGTKAQEHGSRCARIFLGEDDQEMRDLMVAALRRAGHEVIEASNGLDLLRWIQLRRAMGAPSDHDLVVTDVHMPGASGLEVLAMVRRSQPSLPVVLVTAFGDAELRTDAVRLGAAAVFDKPFSLTALDTTLSRLAADGGPLLVPV